MVSIVSRRTLVATLILALTCAPPALADKKRAYELYQQSVEKYRAGQFGEAAALLREAYASEPDPTLLYNLGRACEGMGDDPCAIDAYERYLAAASPPDRGAIEKKIATMRARLPPTTPKPAEPVPIDAPTPARRWDPWPWVVTGSGVALLGAGVAFVVIARDQHDRAAADPVQESAARSQDAAETKMTVGNIFLVAGGVVAASGVVWLALGARDGSAPTNAGVAVGPSSVWLSVPF